MEQKSYKLEIIENLLKRNYHVRKLAKTLDTNHMTIQRKMRELYEENIVDYKQEGKNKVFFIRNNPEAAQYAYMSEEYKFLKILRKYPLLRNAIQKIQENKKIQLAILFGSYAKNTAKNDSDIDLYIETEDNKLKKEIESTDSKLSVKIGKYNKDSLLIKEIEKNHVIIKGVERYYEKNQFFEKTP